MMCKPWPYQRLAMAPRGICHLRRRKWQIEALKLVMVPWFQKQISEGNKWTQSHMWPLPWVEWLRFQNSPSEEGAWKLASPLPPGARGNRSSPCGKHFGSMCSKLSMYSYPLTHSHFWEVMSSKQSKRNKLFMKMSQEYYCLVLNWNCLYQRLTNYFCEGMYGKQCRLCKCYSLSLLNSTVPLCCARCSCMRRTVAGEVKFPLCPLKMNPQLKRQAGCLKCKGAKITA